jgi:hypothetical protein
MELIDPYGTTVHQVAFDFWSAPVLQNGKGEYYCPGYDGETFASSPWDYVKIGGGGDLKTPGIAMVHCHKEYAIDKKKPAGSHGARITVHGIDAADIDIELLIWTPEQLRQLRNLWSIIFPANKGEVQARDVSHPVFSQHGVKSMVFVRGMGPDRGPVVNSRTFTISGIEFAKLSTVKATVSPPGAQPLATVYDQHSHPTPGSNPKNTGPG